MKIKRDITKISVVSNRDGSLKMANRIVGDLENKLIIYGYRKPLRSHTYLPFLPEAIVDEFIDATVVRDTPVKNKRFIKFSSGQLCR